MSSGILGSLSYKALYSYSSFQSECRLLPAFLLLIRGHTTLSILLPSYTRRALAQLSAHLVQAMSVSSIPDRSSALRFHL